MQFFTVALWAFAESPHGFEVAAIEAGGAVAVLRSDPSSSSDSCRVRVCRERNREPHLRFLHRVRPASAEKFSPIRKSTLTIATRSLCASVEIARSRDMAREKRRRNSHQFEQ